MLDSTNLVRSVKGCLGTGGVCVTTEEVKGTCERYDNAVLDVEGFVIPRREPGGWSDTRCGYPIFELPEVAGLRAARGVHRLRMRIGDGSLEVEVEDWLAPRQVRIPSGRLVKGTRGFAAVEPRLEVTRKANNQRTFFLFDDSRLNSDWVVAKYDLGPGSSGFTSEMGEIDPADWTDDGFHFDVPTEMPAGTGTFGFTEAAVEVRVTRCPFAACTVTVNRSATTPGVVVIDP